MIRAIRLESVLRHPPARVWAALTDPDRQSKWLMPSTFRPEIGAAFTLDAGEWGLVRCEVLAIEPERHLSFSWKNPPLDTVVSWRLEPEGEGTRLVFVHDGFDDADPRQQFALENMRGGWERMMTGRLVDAL
jgi:uncharacterized protein YndB with AHSA1/START domain